jgi:hypothetical protein
MYFALTYVSIRELKSFKHYSYLTKWNPSASELRETAEQIVDQFLDAGRVEEALDEGIDNKFRDHVLAHSMLFMREALLLEIFKHGVRWADPGVILRVIQLWMFAFRGAGQVNYMRECLEILLTWRNELTPGLKAALERSWFYNRWGIAGRSIPLDLYLEHLNYWVKVRHSTIDYLI